MSDKNNLNVVDNNNEEPTLGEILQGSKQQVVNDLPLNHAEHEELPSVNRKRGGNKNAAKLGSLVLALVGGALVYAINAPKTEAPTVEVKKAAVSSQLPDIDFSASVISVPEPDPIFEEGESSSSNVVSVSDQTVSTPDSPQQPTWLLRKMSGDVSAKNGSPSHAGEGQGNDGLPVSNEDGSYTLANSGSGGATTGVRAYKTANRDFTIGKGKSLDCTLNTAIDSQMAGMTTCQLSRDIYSDSGRVLLLERGTQLSGEYTGGSLRGVQRLMVMWNEAKTPAGVTIQLNSGSGDLLGRSGLDGYVNERFMKRFGTALLLSFVKDGIDYAKANQLNNSGSGDINYEDTNKTVEMIVAEILRSSSEIKPSLYKNQGDKMKIMVAHDLDFSGVYELQRK